MGSIPWARWTAVRGLDTTSAYVPRRDHIRWSMYSVCRNVRKSITAVANSIGSGYRSSNFLTNRAQSSERSASIPINTHVSPTSCSKMPNDHCFRSAVAGCSTSSAKHSMICFANNTNRLIGRSLEQNLCGAKSKLVTHAKNSSCFDFSWNLSLKRGDDLRYLPSSHTVFVTAFTVGSTSHAALIAPWQAWAPQRKTNLRAALTAIADCCVTPW